MKNNKIKNLLMLFIGLFLLLCVLPITISYSVFVLDVEALNIIPGTGAQWFAFWASYLGAAATVIIAIFTYFNSKSIDEQEKRFLRLFTGSNLRISKAVISQYNPEYKEKEFCRYRFGLKFTNLSYSLIKDMEIQGFYIRIKGDDGIKDDSWEDYKNIDSVGEASYLLQGDAPCLTFDFKFEKGSEEEKKFTDFYYSDYSKGNNKLDIKIKVKPCLYETVEQESIILNITLLRPIEYEKEWGELLYSSDGNFMWPVRKVLIYCYSIQDDADKKIMAKKAKR